jgi:hypothetical protein
LIKEIRMARCIFLALTLLISATLFAQPPGDQGPPLLFNNKNFDGWLKYTNNKEVDREKLIQKDAFDHHIIVHGTAPGYLITEKEYRNYELSFEYRWNIHHSGEKAEKPPEPEECRSGVLFHIGSEGDEIWHKSIKVELRPGRAGDLQLLTGFKMTVNPERKDPKSKTNFLRAHDGAESPPGEWNRVVINCHGKFVSVKFNDVVVMTARDAEVSKGRIAFQSEKGEIHFRNVRLKQLEGKPIDPDLDP